jgi:hypothetical protein
MDVLNLETRLKIIEEIASDENKQRKAESLKRFEIYRERQYSYLIKKLQEGYSVNTVKEMRKIASINLTKRIIDEQASIYQEEPEREWIGASESEDEQLDAIYEAGSFNNQMKKSNRYYKLFDQCALQIIPRKGKIQFKPLAPHMYDVIPDPEDPEQAFAYILNTMDKFEFLAGDSTTKELKAVGKNPIRSYQSDDNTNQSIADVDDYKSELRKYVVWTKDIHFVMNGKGAIVGEIFTNPIGELPFIDIADEKDMEFFVRKGSGIVDFSLDFAALLSDVVTINNLQGYSQAVVYAVKLPEAMTVGPNHVLFLPLNPEQPEIAPKFEFLTPNPDMASAINLLETTLRLFLTSRGLDPKVVSGKLDGTTYSSGIERLLAMIERFEASASDIELFKNVEQQAFEIAVKWSNIMQGVKGDKELIPELQTATVSDAVEMSITYGSPASIQTKAELEDSVIKKIDAQLMSKSEAIAELRNIPQEDAVEILQKIESENMLGQIVPPTTQTIPMATPIPEIDTEMEISGG